MPRRRSLSGQPYAAARFSATLIVAFALLAGCGSSAHRGGHRSHDNSGDPYITDGQGQSIKRGMSAKDAFEALGGKAVSGYNGVQAVPPLSYDYPIRGTSTWWQICVKDGRVVAS